MKAKRRHELQQNVLGLELVKLADFFRQHGTKIMYGIVALAAVTLAIVWFVKHRHEEAEARWSQYARYSNGAGKPDENTRGLESLANQDSDEHLAALASVEVGDLKARQLVDGWPHMSEAERMELRKQAETYYQRAISKGTRDEMALPAAKAHFGLGRLYESFGELDKAREEYQRVLQSVGVQGQPVMMMAQQSLSQLMNGPTSQPVTLKLATTAPAPASQPAAVTQPATGAPPVAPATAPASQP